VLWRVAVGRYFLGRFWGIAGNGVIDRQAG